MTAFPRRGGGSSVCRDPSTTCFLTIPTIAGGKYATVYGALTNSGDLNYSEEGAHAGLARYPPGTATRHGLTSSSQFDGASGIVIQWRSS
jgi:hypothetical protein